MHLSFQIKNYSNYTTNKIFCLVIYYTSLANLISDEISILSFLYLKIQRQNIMMSQRARKAEN